MSVPAAIAGQVMQAVAVIERELGPHVRAIHLFGSTVDGGLKPSSDIDLLVTVDVPPDTTTRHALMQALLDVSAPTGGTDGRRPLEVTVLAHDEVVPWRYPARRELQFGEWLREDLAAGVFEGPMQDHDLAILLAQARRNSIALVGPDAHDLFAPVPRHDLVRALADTIGQWHAPADWAGDERNVVLALARIAFTAATGDIVAKDVAANLLLERLPEAHRGVLREARADYLGEGRVPLDAARMGAFVAHARAMILQSLGHQAAHTDTITTEA